jgi:signal transduction histidine kinase
MKYRIQRRLISLVAAILLMGLGVALLTAKMERQSEILREQLRRTDSESFHIADKFAEILHDVNEPLYDYGRSRTPPDVKKFNDESHKLDAWIDQQKPDLTSAKEKTLMEDIDKAYDHYQQVARELLVRLQKLGDASAPMDEYDRLREESKRLFKLGQELADAHFGTRKQIILSENETITELRVLVLVSLGLLFVFGISLAWVVYRDMILPLRLKLVESESLRERQEKLASLGMLAAGVAHEIRNPLTAIKAALFIQQKKFPPGTPEFADAKIVDREILRLERIVNDFLLFARPSEPQLAKTSVPELLKHVHALLAPQMAGEQIQLVVEECPPLWVKVDAAQIEQVLINLIRNATDAVRENGMVKLRARGARKRINDTEQSVVILEVADNGQGIPPEIQKRLFDPFFTTKDTGTGLGLSIAAGIIQKHGGALQYQTEVDQGTTFGIILPQAIE